MDRARGARKKEKSGSKTRNDGAGMRETEGPCGIGINEFNGGLPYLMFRVQVFGRPPLIIRFKGHWLLFLVFQTNNSSRCVAYSFKNRFIFSSITSIFSYCE